MNAATWKVYVQSLVRRHGTVDRAWAAWRKEMAHDFNDVSEVDAYKARFYKAAR